jgi:hypothetical protein
MAPAEESKQLHTMKTPLQLALATIAPSISIRTIWEHMHDIREDCEGFDGEDPNDWQAWQSEVRATTIHKGEEITGSAYLGGTWEKAGDNPAESNPDISGYENQMTVEALEDLPELSEDLAAQVCAAIEYLKQEAHRAYDAQHAALA